MKSLLDWVGQCILAWLTHKQQETNEVVSYRQFGTIRELSPLTSEEIIFIFEWRAAFIHKIKIIPFSSFTAFSCFVSCFTLWTCSWQGVTGREPFQEPGFDLRRCTSLSSWPSQKSLAWHPLLGIVISKVILDSFFHPKFHSFTTKSQVCAPGIQFMDGIVPHEEDVHERDTSPFTTCELQNGCSQFCLLDTSSLWWWCYPPRLQEEGALVEGSRGSRGSPWCPSSWWWPTDVDHIEQEDPATLPASFSLEDRASTGCKQVLLLPTSGWLWIAPLSLCCISTRVS